MPKAFRDFVNACESYSNHRKNQKVKMKTLKMLSILLSVLFFVRGILNFGFIYIFEMSDEKLFS